MEEGNKRQDSDSGGRNDPEGESREARTKPRVSAGPIVVWSIFALLVVVTVALFHVEISSLRRELDELKARSSEEEKLKNPKKRSSSEVQQESGIHAAHLQGVLPYQHIERQGKIGPWSASTTDDAFISLRKRSTEVEIVRPGLYYVYAQVYYLTSEPHNSFQLLTYNGTEERKHHRHLLGCSSQGRNSMGEASCYAGITATFRPGQRLYLNQVEQNRIIHFADGCSYFGVVLLRENAAFKVKNPGKL